MFKKDVDCLLTLKTKKRVKLHNDTSDNIKDLLMNIVIKHSAEYSERCHLSSGNKSTFYSNTLNSCDGQFRQISHIHRSDRAECGRLVITSRPLNTESHSLLLLSKKMCRETAFKGDVQHES